MTLGELKEIVEKASEFLTPEAEVVIDDSEMLYTITDANVKVNDGVYQLVIELQ